MRRFRGFWAYTAFLLLLPACSDDSPDPSDDEARICNDLVNDGPEVNYSVIASSAPTPAGGTVADGTYELTSMNLYGDPPAPAGVARAVFEIAGTTMEQAGELDGEPRSYTSTFTTSGTTIVIDDTCPEPSRDTAAFTATATELRFFSISADRTFEMALSKR